MGQQHRVYHLGYPHSESFDRIYCRSRTYTLRYCNAGTYKEYLGRSVCPRYFTGCVIRCRIYDYVRLNVFLRTVRYRIGCVYRCRYIYSDCTSNSQNQKQGYSDTTYSCRYSRSGDVRSFDQYNDLSAKNGIR